ncbi:hypothetical protein K439DRAFT_1626647 [Ramaria rubella]|nr:hypothetical protein K439DRAFT_1626647 [Ramaria rubella]
MATNNASISETEYAKKRGDLMKLISSLRSIGAQADLDLPRIVCIGNQSAGKSSLIEAISQIHVPRDSGTCTRCPMECRLSSSSENDPWSANITLRIEFDSSGTRLPETKTYCFGGVINDADAVELNLRRAQAAILNWGSRSYDEFVTMDQETLVKGSHNQEQLKFSKNVVCIAISGPKLTDLVFIDLPGLIQNAEEDMISLVERTVTEQIAGNSIILVTLPMSDDLENQKAALLAKKQDPEGSRTIGVLTKPDTLTTGATRSRSAWLDVIEGRNHPLKHGYYCTRQPEDSDRAKGITFDDAREAELTFFKNTSPWSTSIQKQRFGTRNLTEKLSTLLSQKIDESLPHLRSELKAAIDRTNAELATLPPPLLEDPSSELLNLVTKFCASFEGFVEGIRGSERLIQENHKSYVAFKIAIRRSAPDFRPFVTAIESSGDIIDPSEVVGDEPLPENCILTSEPIYLQDVRAYINRARTRELPNNIPFPAKVALIERFTASWEAPINDCFHAVLNRVFLTLMGLITERFGRFSLLQSRVRAIINDEIHSHMRDTRNMLDTILKFERYPFTQNDHYYQVCREKFLAHFRAIRAGIVQDSSSLAKNRRMEGAGLISGMAPGSPLDPQSETTISSSKEKETKPTFGSGTNAPAKAPGGFAGPSFSFAMSTAPVQMSSTSHSDKSRPAAKPSIATLPFELAPQANTTNTLQPGASAFTPKTRTSGVSDCFNSIENQNQALAALAKLGIHVKVDDLHKLVPSDPWEDELTVAAEVHSYFQTSYKRIIDNVPMTIDNKFFRSLAMKMQSSLIGGLGIGDTERAAAYLAEDNSIVLKREELLSRKKRLESVRQELLKFGY